jgi:hypothetical protein
MLWAGLDQDLLGHVGLLCAGVCPLYTSPDQHTEDACTVACSFRDGRVSYKVFDPVAVRISVQEGVAHRRSLLLELVPRDELPVSERV